MPPVDDPPVRAAMAADVRAPSRPWAMEAAAVAKSLATDTCRGLDDDEARRRLEQFGANVLAVRQGVSSWSLFAGQFANTMTVVLGIAALVTLVIGEYLDTAAIAVILLLNSLFGFAQERRAATAMAALRQLTTTTSRTLRSGAVREVPSPELVPGDVVELASGASGPCPALGARWLEFRAAQLSERPSWR